jgi:FkbM family methyltransferase
VARGNFPPNHEQQLIREFFGARAGFFVEVGANDPHARSQTFDLEQAGWSGILIEPQPDLAEKLRANRKAKVFSVACSGPQNEGKTLQLHVAGPLSSLNRDKMAAGSTPERVIEVPVRTLNGVLEEGGAARGFDFLSIDVEGHELEVLSGFDARRWRPQLILLEDHVENLDKHHALGAMDYRLIRRFENNGWYVPSESSRQRAASDVWEIVRKYYLALPFRVLRNALRNWRRGIKASSRV